VPARCLGAGGIRTGHEIPDSCQGWCVADPTVSVVIPTYNCAGVAIQFCFHRGAVRRVTIGRNVLIAARVFVSGHDNCCNEVGRSARESPHLTAVPVEIGDGAFPGEGCVILKGACVGQRAVVAATAVVTHDVRDFTVVGGVPARVIKVLSPLAAEPHGVGVETWCRERSRVEAIAHSPRKAPTDARPPMTTGSPTASSS
jgi:carbonic anhydrase/acetyltransferase-like protein (isoleucine patch superfamily)